MLRPSLFVLLLLSSVSSYAEVRLSLETLVAQQLQQQDVWIAGPKIRLNHSQQAGDYQIFDLQQGKHYSVSETQLQLTETSLPARLKDQSATLEKIAEGPRLHGFRTQHYRFKAGQQHCADLWLAYDWHSQDAKTWLASWSRLPGLDEGDCGRAAVDALLQLESLGVPFKIVNSQQQLLFQINSLMLNTRILPSSFSLPRIEQQETGVEAPHNPPEPQN